ncbi:unnamed protein product [Gongylonema pulchrum]|uniref:Uncharacterized protein n=1 Tax=Gongylonema pulchrum TaxID=637853 RepID=A0A183EFI8_9BILA|nr:unnamed protein product [Gongylonema pulchrum]
MCQSSAAGREFREASQLARALTTTLLPLSVHISRKDYFCECFPPVELLLTSSPTSWLPGFVEFGKTDFLRGREM